jgi:predicted SnoaL-like aldol condensation-catalyzing enzyme
MSNRETVLAAYDAVFNGKDVAAIERYYGPTYIQHNARTVDGLEALIAFVRQLPPSVRWEPGISLEDDDLVMVQSRTTGLGPTAIIRADIVRLDGGRIVEHWDVSQEEATETASGHPMFEPARS